MSKTSGTSAQMASDLKLSLHDKIWNFDVADPRMHPKGFTVYKVTCRFFSIDRPESLTVVVTWKRYNDFKNLYKSMMNLHKALHRRDSFPVFAKPKVFGRFDDAVVEERRQSALALLNFIGTQPHLYKSQLMSHFLSDGQVESPMPRLLCPETVSGTHNKGAGLDILSSWPPVGDGQPPPDLVPTPAPPPGQKQSDSESHQESVSDGVSHSEGESSLQQSLEVSAPKPLEGTWKFPQVPDSISLDSSTGEDDTDTGDMDSILSSSLPDTDLTTFDPLHADAKDPSQNGDISGMTHSNSWLMEAISTCAHMEDGGRSVQGFDDGVAQFSGSDGNVGVSNKDAFEASQGSNSDLQNSVEVMLTASGSMVEVGMGDENFVPVDLQGLSASMERKVSCGRGDVDLSSHGSTRSHSISSASSAMSTPSHSAGRASSIRDLVSAKATPPLSPSLCAPQGTSSFSPAKAPTPHSPFLSPSKTRLRSPTVTSVSNMDLGGKEDYIYLAASQICLAQNSEASGQYQLAFNYYKIGVGILLQGVQGDANRARRDAVRRKTAQYLMKAEDLYNNHLATENLDERRWAADSYVSPSLELDPSFTFIRGSVQDLRSYQVLGAIDKVILVLDKSTDETFVIKTIPKMAAASITADNSQRSILPTTCPYMVNLHKFFETDYAIYLLLQYASGGRLWSYIAAYLHQSSNAANATGDGNNFAGGFGVKGNAYMGQKMHEDTNAINDKKTGAGMAAVPLRKEKETKAATKPLLPSSGIRFSDLQAKLKSPDSDDMASVSKKDTNEQMKASQSVNKSPAENTSVTDIDSTSYSMGDESFPQEGENMLENTSFTDPRRLSSLSSDENYRSISQEDSQENTDKFPETGEMDEAADRFHELLRQNKVNLENFSINSFDSDNVRLSSTFSTSEATTEVDMPGSLSSSSPPACGVPLSSIPDEVFTTDGTAPLLSSVKNQEDVHDILQNSRELLRTVERTLSQVDGVENAVKDSDMLGNTEDMGQKECCKTCTESVGSEEISIYDAHRHSDESDSADTLGENSSICVSDVEKKDQQELTSVPESEETADSVCDDIGNTGLGNADGAVNGGDMDYAQECSSASCFIPEETVSRKLTHTHTLQDSGLPTAILGLQFQENDNEVSVSDTSDLSGVVRRKTASTHSIKTTNTSRRISYSRTTSGEMVRSASFECDLKSPTRNRARAISDLFDQMDHEKPEQAVLPEAVVRRWTAELVIALSRLHALGIICRDLKPDNVLLGEGGHIFITYFCQVGQAEKELDWSAVEQMYVAPEVRSISGSDTSCDWWSLGALLYELLVGKSLHLCHPGGILPYTNILIPSHVSDEGRSLLQELLRYNPRERLGSGIAGAEEIKAHNFFATIDWHHLEYV